MAQGTSIVAQLVKNPPVMRETGTIPGLGRPPGEGKGYPVFWPGEFHGLYSPWGHKESDTTERLSLFTLWHRRNNEKALLY